MRGSGRRRTSRLPPPPPPRFDMGRPSHERSGRLTVTDQPREKRRSAEAQKRRIASRGMCRPRFTVQYQQRSSTTYRRITVEQRRGSCTHSCHGVSAARLELSTHQLRQPAGKDFDREVSSQRLFTASLLPDRDQQDEQTRRMEAGRVVVKGGVSTLRARKRKRKRNHG